MNISDLPDQSDSSDEDYVPEGTNAELPSEEESDGDQEDPLSDKEEASKRGNKRQKKVKRPKKKRKTIVQDEPEEKPKEEKSEEDKQKTDDLWADFMKDTGFKTKAQRMQTTNQTSNKVTNSTDTNNVKPKETEPVKEETPKTVKVKQVFEFAGEEVIVEKEVNADSVEARLGNKASGSVTSTKKPVRGGITSLLSQLGKKSKINTLEKSKLDWERFKKEEDIEDELLAYGKSKDGYLEKQDFLQRADLRRFEIEKEVRTTLRSNRLNNV